LGIYALNIRRRKYLWIKIILDVPHVWEIIIPVSEIADVTIKKNAAVLRDREVRKEYPAVPVIKGLLDVPAVPVMMGLRVLRVVPAAPVMMGLPDLRAAQVVPVLPDLPDLPAQLARKVFLF
jgi:hypothetical protein